MTGWFLSLGTANRGSSAFHSMHSQLNPDDYANLLRTISQKLSPKIGINFRFGLSIHDLLSGAAP